MATVLPYRHVLVALDEAEEWHAVAARAHDVARRNDARMTVMHVVDQRGFSAGAEADVPLFGISGETTEREVERALTEPPPVPFSLDERMIGQARRFLDAVVGHLADPRVETAVLASSTVGHEIAATARRLQADLLVCGAHDRHGLALFLPSTVDGLTRRLPCDLLLVRLSTE